MALSQYIYISTCIETLTPSLSHEMSRKSATICKGLGITGRVFANDKRALAITEGPSDIVKRYFEAVSKDDLVKNIALHAEREIPAREFEDYSVWLNSIETPRVSAQVRVLSDKSLASALPPNLSAQVQSVIETFVKPELLGS